MKRLAAAFAILGFAVCAGAQSTQPAPATPAGGSTPAAASQPATKRPPQAKTQPEYDAWKAAAASTDPAGLEKAADDFATKFPDSELRILLFKNAMRAYQNANQEDKVEVEGRKVIAIDGDDPEALISVAEVIADKTRDTDLDKDLRFADGIKLAEKGLTTIDTDVSVPTGATPQQVDTYKASLRSRAYSSMGAMEYARNNFAAAQANFQKAIDATPSDPYAFDVFRLALSIDKQATAESDAAKQKALYGDALKVAQRAVDTTKDNDPVGISARRERDRLQQLTGATPTPAATAPAKN